MSSPWEMGIWNLGYQGVRSAGCQSIGSSGLGELQRWQGPWRLSPVGWRRVTWGSVIMLTDWGRMVVSSEHQEAENAGGLSPLGVMNREWGRLSSITTLLLPLPREWICSPLVDAASHPCPTTADSKWREWKRGSPYLSLWQLRFAPAILGQLCRGSSSLPIPGFHFCPSCRQASILCVWFAQSVLITPLTYAVELLVSITAWRWRRLINSEEGSWVSLHNTPFHMH